MLKKIQITKENKINVRENVEKKMLVINKKKINQNNKKRT